MANQLKKWISRVNAFVSEHELICGLFFLTFLSALCYLPFISGLGFYNDDWYLVYIKYAGSWERFITVFAEDRPARAYVVSAAFSLFSASPLLFSLSGYLLRLGSVLSAWWLMRMVWPQHKKTVYWAVVLFAVYPGFLDQPQAIDYQSHLLSFFLVIFSIGLSVRAWFARKLAARAGWIVGALATGFLYPLLMEYYIGLEAFRFILLGYLELRRERKNWKVSLWALLRVTWPYIILAFAFLAWRAWGFQGERNATDVQGMFEGVGKNPLLLFWMAVNLAQDTLTVLFGAWFVPIYNLLNGFRLREMFLILGIAVVGVGVAWWFFARIKPAQTSADESDRFGRDLIWIGLFAAVCALLPVTFGNRRVLFAGYGRFTLPASLGVALFLAGLGARYLRGWARTAAPLLLVILALMTHSANTLIYVENWAVVKNFWWQVNWRAPQIEAGTTIIARYAGQPIPEDYAIWGPANLVYYPNYQDNEGWLNLPLTAMTTNVQDIVKVREGQVTIRDRRATRSTIYPNQLLVLSQPFEKSCVHVLNQEELIYSSQDSNEILLVGPYSDMSRIDVQAQSVQPPAEIFGAEPAHGWCYYFEQADLAAQRGDWERVTQLGQAAENKDLSPADAIEWFPFVRAYAYLGHEDKVRALVPILTDDPYIKHQVCRVLTADLAGIGQKYPQGQQLLLDTMCQSDGNE